MLALDKIFATVSSTTFVYRCHYNQHKINVPQRGFFLDLNYIWGCKLNTVACAVCYFAAKIISTSTTALYQPKL